MPITVVILKRLLREVAIMSVIVEWRKTTNYEHISMNLSVAESFVQTCNIEGQEAIR
jgi:hypothetical protein